MDNGEKTLQGLVTDIKVFNTKLDHIDDSIKKLEERQNATHAKINNLMADMQKNYVSKETFTPIQRGFYAIVFLIVSGVITGVLATVMK